MVYKESSVVYNEDGAVKNDQHKNEVVCLEDMDSHIDWEKLYEDAQNHIGTDYIVRAGDKTVHCHQYVLDSQSRFFEWVIKEGYHTEFTFPADALGSVVEEDDNLEAIIRFLYLDHIDLTEENIIGILTISTWMEQFSDDERELTEYCQIQLLETVSAENYIRYHNMALQFGLTRLEKECIRIDNVIAVLSLFL